jgi:hypothetical protein
MMLGRVRFAVPRAERSLQVEGLGDVVTIEQVLHNDDIQLFLLSRRLNPHRVNSDDFGNRCGYL